MTENKTRTRMKVLAWLVAFMFAALATRLWFLQVLASEQFVKLADQNQVRLIPIQPVRGLVLARDGKTILVGNRPSTIVTVDRLGMQGRDDEVLFRLASLLKQPVSDLLDRLNSVKYLPYQPVPVAEDVDKNVVFYIEEHRDLFPGVSYMVGSVRNYPEHSLAAHLLGYVGEISDTQLSDAAFKGYRQGEIVGKAGVEVTYEHDLHGIDGLRGIQVNAQGTVLDDNFGGTAPTAGNNVVLSIDPNVQRLSQAALQLGIDLGKQVSGTGPNAPGPHGGAVLVMNPDNGQILAMASNPTFDPSVFTGGLNRREALSLDICYKEPCPAGPIHDSPLLNRAIDGLYPAGSTFKPFVGAAALKEHLATLNGKYGCPPGYVVPHDISGHVFHNWSSANYGNISLAQALVISCDTVFYKFGYDFYDRFFRKSGRTDETFQRDLGLMGFGRKTEIDLPSEAIGHVPTDAYVRGVFKSNPRVYGKYPGWQAGDSVVLAIGQGFLTVSPLQLATAYAAIANGGTLYAPTLGMKIQSPDGELVRTINKRSVGVLPISQRQVAYLRNALTGVTRSGTAMTAFAGFPLDRIPVAGKTGTADIQIGNQQPYSWFAAMAPANHPKYVVIALVEQGGHGATTAAPIVRRVLEGLFGIPAGGPLKIGSVQD
jgi:penicillin-binding protein 2